MTKKIRIMYAMGGSMKRAGAETMIMQYLRQLIHDPAFEFSILVHGDEQGDYDKEIQSMGVPIYHVPVRGQHPLTYNEEVAKVLLNHLVDIIHCNMDNASGHFLKIAKKCGIPVRIAHSHTTRILAQNPIKKIAGFISKREIHTMATHRLACSQKAGDWLFGTDPYRIINNAINLEQYRYNSQLRKEIRSQLNISEDTLAICHIGSFTYPKNHQGLLHLFKSLIQVRPDTKLLLAGVGPLMESIRKLSLDMHLQDHVVFLGLCTDIPALLQAADVFVMPSLMEGLPVSGIEAQAAGIPCLFADTVTPEICMTSYARQVPLHDEEAWVKALSNISKVRDCESAEKSLTMHGYNIQKEAEKLDKYYKIIINNTDNSYC